MASMSEDRVRRGLPRPLWAALLVVVLLAAAGCGKEPEGNEATSGGNVAPLPGTSPSGGSAAPSQGPMSMEGTYEDTGLPKRITLDGRSWEISQDIDAPEGTYEKGTQTVNGQPVYHDPGAKSPYGTIYLRVPGKDRYLQYAPVDGKSSP